MKKNIKRYFKNLKDVLSGIVATGENGEVRQFDEALQAVIRLILDRAKSGGKVLFIGNGASASIASHMATDFWKNAGIRAHAFNDSSLLTCISNDYGYKHVFEKPIEMFAEPNDILVGISSSGRSKNILRGISAAKKRGLKIVTLSGFDDDNPLRKLGDINFYVPASTYGPVEITHTSICHCLIDMIIEGKNG